jgi:aquaporin Z
MTSSNKIIFIAELIGTFGLVVGATGSIVYNEILGGIYGISLIAVGHFIALTIVVYAFGKYSMAHFNPAVTIAFFITKHVSAKHLPVYFTAQAIGAFLGSVFVLFVIGDYANIGTNAPNLEHDWASIIGIEIIATVLLMWVIYIVVSNKKLAKLSGVAIGGIVALDVLFFGEVSGASMNPIRSLAPAIISGIPGDLWLYWTTPFTGTMLVAVVYNLLSRRKKSTSTH